MGIKKVSLIDELKKTRGETNNIDAIKKIHYTNIISRIKSNNSYGNTSLVYTVPLFLPSFQLYDINIVINYLISKLQRDGLKVSKLKDYDLYITW